MKKIIVLLLAALLVLSLACAKKTAEQTTKIDAPAAEEKDTVTISQLSDVPIAMEEMYQGQVLAAFKAKEANIYLKSLSSSPSIAAKMAKAGLAVALVSINAAQAMEAEGLAIKQISDGASLAARYCLLTQRGNYRSQVVSNFVALLAEEFRLNLSDAALPSGGAEEI